MFRRSLFRHGTAKTYDRFAVGVCVRFVQPTYRGYRDLQGSFDSLLYTNESDAMLNNPIHFGPGAESISVFPSEVETILTPGALVEDRGAAGQTYEVCARLL